MIFMGVLDADIAAFMNDLDGVIDEAMELKVRDAAAGYIQAAVITEVYMKYEPKGYDRKMDKHGLADIREAPSGSIESHYESQTKTLTVENVREDWEPTMRKHEGRNVAKVVESGEGYDWRQIKPRPFHKIAEENLIRGGDVDFHIEETFKQRMGAWSR